MAKTLKEIIQNSNDIYSIKVDKPSGKERHNSSNWKYRMNDPRWTDPAFDEYTFKTVHLRRENGFFLAYKCDDSNAYFVDPKRSMYRNSVIKYVNNLVEYSMKTNDISRTKNEPSFRITQGEMRQNKIDNFLDLCFYYRDYTAIGTGYTRDVRNLVVMDIDVDCTKPDNRMEIKNLLDLLAGYDSLPDFYIFNHKSNHIQLQWLIKDLQYKDVSEDVVTAVINDLNNDPDKNKEIDFRKIDFSEISELGVLYRKYIRALCDIVKKRKFGDKNYTFWKAKNPMSALAQVENLELMMPYYEDGEVKFRTDEEMNIMFFTKDARKKYFDNAPTLSEWYSKLSELMDPLVDKITDKKVMKIDDAKDITEIKETIKAEKKRKPESECGESRNNFVMEYTRYVTSKLAKEYGCRKMEDFKKMSHESFNTFKREVYSRVYQKFKEKDNDYGGIWPGTTNISKFTNSEFKKVFDSSFTYVIQNNNDYASYTDENRKHSQLLRQWKSELKLIVVDNIRRHNTKITRKELLREANKYLQKIYINKISMGSLKRFIAESKELTDKQRLDLNDKLNNRKERIESRNS